MKFVDDYYSEALQVDKFVLSLKDKLTRDEDDRVSGQQGEPSHTQPQPTILTGTTAATGGETTEEGDESLLNIPPLVVIYLEDIPKSG